MKETSRVCRNKYCHLRSDQTLEASMDIYSGLFSTNERHDFLANPLNRFFNKTAMSKGWILGKCVSLCRDPWDLHGVFQLPPSRGRRMTGPADLKVFGQRLTRSSRFVSKHLSMIYRIVPNRLLVPYAVWPGLKEYNPSRVIW